MLDRQYQDRKAILIYAKWCNECEPQKSLQAKFTLYCRSHMFYRKGDLKTFQTCNFIKKETPTLVFLSEFLEIFNNTHWEKLSFTQFSTRIYWNSSLADSELFHMFTQSIKFFTFHCHILKSTNV